MRSITFQQYLQKLPKKRREAILRGIEELEAECEAMHTDDPADAGRPAGASDGATAGGGEGPAATPVPMSAKGE